MLRKSKAAQEKLSCACEDFFPGRDPATYVRSQRLRDELPDHQRLILAIGYHLGMCRGEIFKLRWNQVDWDANLIRLEKKQTKRKQARVALLYGELRAWLEMAYSARQDCPFIVSWRGAGISEVKTAWTKARKRASVPSLLVHDLRRTAVRNMIRAGIPRETSHANQRP